METQWRERSSLLPPAPGLPCTTACFRSTMTACFRSTPPPHTPHPITHLDTGGTALLQFLLAPPLALPPRALQHLGTGLLPTAAPCQAHGPRLAELASKGPQARHGAAWTPAGPWDSRPTSTSHDQGGSALCGEGRVWRRPSAHRRQVGAASAIRALCCHTLHLGHLQTAARRCGVF